MSREANETGPVSKEKLRVAQIRVFLDTAIKNEGSGMVAALLIALAAIYVDGKLVWNVGVITWLALVELSLAIGILAAHFLRIREWPDDVYLKFAQLTHYKLWPTSAIWGSASWLMLPAPSPTQETLIVVGMLMTIAASSSGMVAYPAFHRTNLIAMGGVFIAGLLRFGDDYKVILAILFLSFTLTLFFSARDQQRSIARTIRLSMENQNLSQRREEERARAVSARNDADQARLRAELADRGKATFIAAASHDLRQPLHALVQYVGHLKQLRPTAEQTSTVERIDESVAAISGLLNAVLDFSKISMGSMKPEWAVLSVADLLTTLRTQVEPLAAEEGLKIRWDTEEVWVESDRALLERILRNLIHNAIRYTNRGGVSIRSRRHGNLVRILVADSGIGISPDDRSRIFEEYFQADNPERDRRKGLGLGLAIVKELATLLGVRIRLKSRLNKGSVFALELRASAPPEQPARVLATASQADLVAGALVLLVDDDELVRHSMSLTLSDMGCRVVSADSADQAILRLQESEFAPQVILCDYRLQKGTGLEAIRAIRNAHCQAFGEEFPLAAIVISGDTSPQEIERVSAAGLPLLHKPVEVQDLRTAIQAELAVLSRRPASA